MNGTGAERHERKRAPLASRRGNGAASPADSSPATANGSAPVLVAGTDPAARAAVRRELGELMPAGTHFEELGTFWELLGRAPSSRMVVLSGELDETPAETLLHALGHRHPDLPVVSFERPSPQEP